MLRALYLKDFAIVTELELEFPDGLSVISGETGAGKSLLVDALGLVAGGRGDAAMVRHGAERAEIAAEITPNPAVTRWLSENDLSGEEATVQLRRVLRSEGSSRAYINGRPVPAQSLRELAACVLEIHGQHEHQALLARPHQLDLLDAFGVPEAVRTAVVRSSERLRLLRRERAGLAGGEDAAARRDLLIHEIAELETDALERPAWEALVEDHRRHAHAEELLAGADQIRAALDGEHELAVLGQLQRLHSETARLAHMDTRLDAVAKLLDSAAIEITEACDGLDRYAQSIDIDPDALRALDARLARLHDLARKYRSAPDRLAEALAERQRELAALEGAESRRSELDAQINTAQADYEQAAAALSAARKVAADRLGDQVSRLMQELGMGGGRFAVELETTDSDDHGPSGRERAEFVVSANPGQPLRPLRKVASGGELSRISLAIKVATLGQDDIPILVFDEVDAGIGGATADILGAMLARLAARRQVLCVTHLAQIAAHADRHLRVLKIKGSSDTSTSIETLQGPGREQEIARMLGGDANNAEALAHARALLTRAAR